MEALQAELSAPTQFKGRLNELMSQVRLQSQSHILSGQEKCSVDPFVLKDIKNVLKQQQEGIQALVSLIREDMGDLAMITEKLEEEEKKKQKTY